MRKKTKRINKIRGFKGKIQLKKKAVFVPILLIFYACKFIKKTKKGKIV